MQNEEQKDWRIHAVSEGCNVTVIDPHFVCRWTRFPHKQDFWNPSQGFLKQQNEIYAGQPIKFDSLPTALS